MCSRISHNARGLAFPASLRFEVLSGLAAQAVAFRNSHGAVSPGAPRRNTFWLTARRWLSNPELDGPKPHCDGLHAMRGLYPAVSTYIVGFCIVLAEHFLVVRLGPLFMRVRRHFQKTRTSTSVLVPARPGQGAGAWTGRSLTLAVLCSGPAALVRPLADARGSVLSPALNRSP